MNKNKKNLLLILKISAVLILLIYFFVLNRGWSLVISAVSTFSLNLPLNSYFSLYMINIILTLVIFMIFVFMYKLIDILPNPKGWGFPLMLLA
jgi:hypothetical protein